MLTRQTTFIALLIFISCKAQQPVLDISDRSMINETGAYYKDTHNLLDPFVGTYVYTNGTTSFTMVLQKKTMSSVNGRYYEDLIIGEYRYIRNGIELLNTLNNLNENFPDGRDYNIRGSFIIEGKDLGCDECDDTEKRLRVSLSDSPIQRIADLDIRKITQNEREAIQVELWWTIGKQTRNESDPPKATPRIPTATYIMFKQ